VSAADPRAAVLAFLRAQGLIMPGEPAAMTALTGGVSSDLWKVDLPGRSVCVKGSLAQLKVPGEWLAPVSRNRVECDWLSFAASLCPGQVPQVLAHDSDARLFAMEYLPPEQYPVWKTELIAGRVDLRAARQVGDLVGRIHAASAADPSIPGRFATDGNFVALRIEPYLRATSKAHPDLRHTLDALAERTMSTSRALVHGDVSPKNILLGPQGPLLLDAECAWFGDPAFDVAFCVNHLLIKSILIPGRGDELMASARTLASAHARHVGWEPRQEFDSRVASLLPALALSRVDGMSPVEYLDQSQRNTLRHVSRSLLQALPRSVEELLTRWTSAAASAPVATSGPRASHRAPAPTGPGAHSPSAT
jgi:tRNA A-37 threonylcarbamoyl transferase component Bud32